MVDNLPKRDVYKIMGLIEAIAMTAREGLTVEGSNFEEKRGNLLAAGQIS